MKIQHETWGDIYMGEMSKEEFYDKVAARAYYKAEKRGFEAGHELDDWLEAEKEMSNHFRYWSLG